MHIFRGVGQAQGVSQFVFRNRRPEVATSVIELTWVKSGTRPDKSVGIRIVFGTGRAQLGRNVTHVRARACASQGTILGNDVGPVLIMAPTDVNGTGTVPGPNCTKKC